MSFVFGPQTLKLIDFSKIYQLKGLQPKNKGHTNLFWFEEKVNLESKSNNWQQWSLDKENWYEFILSYAKKNKWKILKYCKYYILYHNFTDAFSMSQLELHFDIKTSLMFFQKYEIPSNHAVYIFKKTTKTTTTKTITCITICISPTFFNALSRAPIGTKKW